MPNTAPARTVTLHLVETATASYKRDTVNLPLYRVEVDGEPVGVVFRDMATRERRTPGRRYVNARWQSPAWYGAEGSGNSRYTAARGLDRPARVHALKHLLADVLGMHFWDAEALARASKVVKP